MTVCTACGEVVDKTDDSTCKSILRFCMVHNISPRELVDLENGRYARITDAFGNLPDDAKSTIHDLAKKMKTEAGTTVKPKGRAKGPASKKKGQKKKQV